MDAKEILQKIKQVFSEFQNPAPVAQAAPSAAPAAPGGTEYQLKDGGTVMIDKLEPGGVVMIDGNPSVPGEIELADGTMITISDNGVIANIVPAGTPAVDMGQMFSEFKTSTEAKFNEYETKFSAYEERFKKQEEQLSKASKVIEQLLQLSQVLVDAPAAPADPAVKPITAFGEQKKDEQPKDILKNITTTLFSKK